MNTEETEAISVFTKRFPNNQIVVIDDNHMEVDGIEVDRVGEEWVVSVMGGSFDHDTGWEVDHEDLGSFNSLSTAIGFALVEAMRIRVQEAQVNIGDNLIYLEETIQHVSGV